MYDSMIAKIIVKGKDRSEAIRIMERALKETMIGPIKTTVPFHLKLLGDPNFLKGRISTHYLESFLGKPKAEEEA